MALSLKDDFDEKLPKYTAKKIKKMYDDRLLTNLWLVAFKIFNYGIFLVIWIYVIYIITNAIIQFILENRTHTKAYIILDDYIKREIKNLEKEAWGRIHHDEDSDNLSDNEEELNVLKLKM